jgi:hypothetical protein
MLTKQGIMELVAKDVGGIVPGCDGSKESKVIATCSKDIMKAPQETP